MTKVNVVELVRLLEAVEKLPVGTKTADGKFLDLRRLNKIDEEIQASQSPYRLIAGKKNYFKLYGQLSLDDLSNNYDKVLLISTHADNWQNGSSYEDRGENINGNFDNAVTNAVATYIIKYGTLPKNVLFAFTSDEECESKGAEKLVKKLNRYFGKGNVNVIVLDVTCGWHDGAAFTIENDFIYEGDGEYFIRGICKASNSFEDTFDFVKAASDCKSQNPEDYVPSEKIRSYMGNNCKKTTQYINEYEGADESFTYDEYDANVFSLCLPCSAEDADEMHECSGFEISKAGVEKYTQFLMYVLEAHLYE